MGHLTLEQRYKIETYLSLGRNKSEIAAYIGKDKSVISREIKRNADARSGVYKAALADKKAKLRHQTKAKKIHFNDEVKTRVEALIRQDYSPEQIEGRCKMKGIPIVSKETIYQYIWKDKRQGGLLYKHLRTKGKRYRKRGDSNDKRGLMADRVDISMRSEIVDKKLRIGDLEIDLVIGSDHKGALLTINDRATGILFMDKIENKEVNVVQAKAIELLDDWKPFIHTINLSSINQNIVN